MTSAGAGLKLSRWQDIPMCLFLKVDAKYSGKVDEHSQFLEKLPLAMVELCSSSYSPSFGKDFADTT